MKERPRRERRVSKGGQQQAAVVARAGASEDLQDAAQVREVGQETSEGHKHRAKRRKGAVKAKGDRGRQSRSARTATGKEHGQRRPLAAQARRGREWWGKGSPKRGGNSSQEPSPWGRVRGSPTRKAMGQSESTRTVKENGGGREGGWEDG